MYSHVIVAVVLTADYYTNYLPTRKPKKGVKGLDLAPENLLHLITQANSHMLTPLIKKGVLARKRKIKMSLCQPHLTKYTKNKWAQFIRIFG